MLYRVRQFCKAIFPLVYSCEIQWLSEILPAQALSLFRRQSKSEQRHALDVTKSLYLRIESLALNPNDYRDLLIAALLHDCGKTLVQMQLWHRVLIVLMQGLPLLLRQKVEKGRSFLSLPLRISSRHAEWGELLASRTGLNEQICLLIRQHHFPKTELGKWLQEADNEN